jgi:hypothetical protein
MNEIEWIPITAILNHQLTRMNQSKRIQLQRRFSVDQTEKLNTAIFLIGQIVELRLINFQFKTQFFTSTLTQQVFNLEFKFEAYWHGQIYSLARRLLFRSLQDANFTRPKNDEKCLMTRMFEFAVHNEWPFMQAAFRHRFYYLSGDETFEAAVNSRSQPSSVVYVLCFSKLLQRSQAYVAWDDVVTTLRSFYEQNTEDSRYTLLPAILYDYDQHEHDSRESFVNGFLDRTGPNFLKFRPLILFKLTFDAGNRLYEQLVPFAWSNKYYEASHVEVSQHFNSLYQMFVSNLNSGRYDPGPAANEQPNRGGEVINNQVNDPQAPAGPAIQPHNAKANARSTRRTSTQSKLSKLLRWRNKI